MEPWGVDQKSTEEAVEPLSQGEVSASGDAWYGAKKGRKTRVALIVAGALALMAGGTLHDWRKAAAPNVSGSIQREEKGVLGKFADNLREGASLLVGARSDSAKNIAASKTTKMSGTPLSLPLFFEENHGQTDPRVKFLARSGGYSLFVTPTETVFASAHTSAPRGALSITKDAPTSLGERAVLRMKLLESNPGPEISGIKELPGKVNYLIGNNPKDWHTGVPLYEEVRSREVYPGIDLVFHGDQQRLEYDFQVAPGADPGRIRFKVTGVEKIAVDENGDLLLRTGKNEFRMRKPVVYQQDGERRKPVDGGFSLQAGKQVAFHTGAYDKKKTLVIDPTIIFASFLGAAGQELPAGMDLDTTTPGALKLYLSGTTTDVTTFAETNAKLGTTPGAGTYAFVAKIDPTTTGSASLNFLTFIGGSLLFGGGTGTCQNLATDLKLDQSGGAGQVEPVLLGDTNCRDFPITVGGTTTGTDDLFLTRLTPSGAGIDGSTLFGGNGSAGLTYGGGASLFVNPEGSIVLSGDTTSTDFATTANAYSVSFNNGTPGGFDDCFIGKLDRSFNLLYLTYLNVGGNSTSGNPAGCGVGSVDPAGKIYFGGNIYSATAFNLANGGAGANGFEKTFVGTPGTTPNAFVGVLDPSLSGLNQLTYSTYISGGGGTTVQAGAVDVTHGIAVLVGTTISNNTTNAPDIPLLNAIQSVNNSPTGVGTGWITVIDTTKTGLPSLAASTYYGGSAGAGSSSVRSVAIDSVPGNSPTQRIVVGGQTTATDFPTMNPLQASLVGSQNAFVSVLSVPSPGNTFNMAQLFSTYLGGGATATGQGESIRALLTDSNHQVYALGRTASANFFGNTVPATSVNGFQTTCASCGGGTPVADLAIFVLTPQSGTNVPDLTVSKSHSGTFSQGQSGAQFSITVTNSGSGTTVGTVTLADSLPSSLTATAMTGTGWSCSIGTLVCTRADGLGAGSSYPVITLTVNVASNAPPSVTNTVVVSGGSETNTGNDTASDTVAITSSVGACTNNYVGATGGSWGTATNWSSGAVPVSTDVVCIPSGITVLVNTGLAAANQTISGLNSSGTITFTSGPLSVTNNSVANAINMNGGTLAFNGQLTVGGSLAVTGGNFGGTGEIDANGAFTWSGGTICSTITGVSCATGANATLNANLGITFPASSNVVLSSRTLNNNGTATWSGANGSIDMVNGAVINNAASRVWNYANDSGLSFGGGSAVAFNNLGTFEKTGGTVTSNIGVNFNNSGSVLGASGTLSFTGGGSCGSSCPGTFTAVAPGTMAFAAGVFTQSGPINGSGSVNFNGGTVNFGSGVEIISATTINITGGVLGGAAPGVLNFETRPNWTGGTMCSSLSGASCIVGINGTTNANAGINFPASSNVILSDRTLNNNGTATWSGTNGSVDMVNGAVINNVASSVWNYTNDSSLVFGGGTAVTFNNVGTFEKTAGTSTSTIGINFNNTGTVLGNSGILSFTGGGACGSTCSGTFTAATPGIISFAANVFGQSGPINGSGTVNFNGGTVNFGTGTETIATATVNFSSGTLGGASPGILNFSTPLNWTGGTMCSSLTGASCVVGTNATTNANAGINFPASSSVVLSDRTLNNNGTATWSGAAGSLDLINGAILNNAVTGVWNYTNDSTLVYGGGNAVSVNNAGTFEKTAGTATSTIGINFNNTGTVLGNSGTLTFTGGGTCGSTCPGTFTPGTNAAISFAANVFGQSGPINGAGTVNFNGGTVDFGTGTETITTTTVNFSAGTLGGASPGILNFSTPLNWTGGTMCSSLTGASCIVGTNATTNANAGINFPASSSVVLSDRTLNNNGTATWSGAGGSFDMINGAILNNTATGVWNYANDSTLVYGGGNAVSVNNAGTFEKTAGTATTTIGINFNNTGSVLGNSGNLSFSAGGNCGSTCSGSFAAGASGALSFPSGTYPVSGPFNGTGTVNFNGGTLNLTGTYGVTGPTNVSAGTVNFNEASPMTVAGPVNFTGGTIAGSTSTLNLAGLLTWSGGTLGLPGTTNATGNIAFPNVGAMILNLGVLNTPGAVTFAAGGSGSGFFQENGAVVNNTGTWNLQGDDSVNYNGGTATTFNNNAGGIFEKTGGTTSSTVGVAFNNNGTVTDGTTSGSATLNFSSGLCSTLTPCTGNGAWNVLAGYTLTFGSGVYSPSGTFSGAGTMNFIGATVNLTGPYGVTGPTNISAGAVNFNEASPVTVAGALNFTGGTIAGSTSTLNLPGLFTWSAGTLGLPGTTNATGGIAFPNVGAMVQNGGILNTSSPVTFAVGGSGSSFLQANAAVVNNTSTWNLQGDDFVSYNGGTATAFNNNSSGIFEKTGGTGTSQVSTGFINNGTVTVGTTPGSGTVVFSIGVCSPTAPCTGSGSWNVLTGYTLSFLSGVYNLSGPINVAGTLNFGGAAMTLTGPYGVTGPTNFSAGIVNFNEASPVTIAGPVNLTGGTIAGSTSTLNLPGLFTWSAGTLGLPGTTNVTGNIAFPSAGAMVQNGGILNTSGTVTFAPGGSGSSFLQSNGAVLNNTGTWNIQGDDFVTYNGGTATTFNNNTGGIFEKTGGTATSQVTTAFNNAGTVLANAATLFFTNNVAQTAGKTTLNGGSIQTTSTHPLALQGGSLTGAGTLVGDVTNTGGSVAPGSSTVAGAITINGSALGIYSQSGTGAYSVKIGGTAAGQFDRLTMSGAATLGGPLNVSLINSFSPVLGNTFTILSAASVTGTFSTTNLPALTPGLGWQVSYTGTTVVLSVVAVSTPIANLNPGSLTFPNTIVNTAAAVQKVQLQNTGTGPLIITSIQPTGTDAANYSYTADAVQPCPISPASLANGASCLLDIGFLPLSSGTHNNAQITVTDNSGSVVGSTQTVALSGTGIVLSSIAVTPASVTVTLGNTQQFTATGTYSDSSTQNLTNAVTWASSSTATATINSSGVAQTVAPGTTNITAKQGSVTSPVAVLTVTGATHFAVSAPGTVTAGTSFLVSVFAEDQFNNLVPGYTGTVHITSSDGAAVLPANTTLTTGSGGFQVTLKTLGSQTVTATDTVTATITGTSSSITVGSGLATHFQVTMPGLATVGVATSVNVVALDQFNNPVTSYTGTVHFTSSDALAVLPANTTLTAGAGTFPVTFKTAGSQTVTATDTVTATITGTSNTNLVSTGTVTHLLVVASPSVTAGTAFPVAVEALDQFNNIVTSYTGTVHFTSTDGAAVLPANSTLTNGIGSFQVTLKTTGSQTVTATDTVTATITGISNPITVSTTTATHFLVTAPPSATAGTAVSVSVVALDQFSNVVTGYAGTVHFTSSDAAAVLPANSTLTSGVGVFQVTLKTAGNQTVTATDTVTAGTTGVSNTIAVGSIAATHLLISAPGAATAGAPFNIIVTALDQFSNIATGYTGTVHFTSTDGAAVLPANVTLINGTNTLSVTLKTLGSQTITGTDTVTATITGTSNAVSVSSGVATHFVVSAPGVATAGTAISVSVTALDSLNNIATGYAGTVHFTSTDGAATLPANSILASGTGTFQATLRTAGSQTVTATDTVNGTINGTTGAIVVTAVLQTITVAPTSASVAAGLTQPFTATGHFSDGTTGAVSVNWSSANTAIATINSSGVATGVAAGGPITITATSTTNAAISGTAQLTVTAAALQSITVAPTSASVSVGLTQPFTATGHFSDGTSGAVSVNWSSANTAIATINASGVATGVSAGGPITITATSTTNAAISGTAQLTVTGATLQTITVAPTSASVAAGLTQPFTATGHFSDGTSGVVSVNWSSANTAVATINSSGVATGVSAGGPITITATSTTNAAISGTAQLTVTAAVLQTITVAPSSANVAAGLTQPFTATGHFSNGTTGVVSVNWSSANTAIATINSSGIATGVSAGGPITITATSTTNAAISGTAQLTVTAAVLQTITVSPTAAGVAAGSTVPFGATGHFSDGTSGAVSVNWSSSNTAIATINSSGVATGVAAGGPVTIRATSTTNAAISGTALLTVSAAGPTLQTISVTPANPTLATNAIQAFMAIGHFSDGTSQNLTSTVTWASATTTVATINAAGVATGVGPGTSTISATLGAVSGTTVLTVSATTAHAYVGDSVSATCCLDVIDITTNQIVKQIPITTINEPLGITPDQSRVYVPDNAGSVLDVVDTTTNTLVNTIPVGNGTTAVVINPNGQFGYVSDLNDANVVVFNVATGAVVATVPIGFSAGWISITPDGAFVYAASDSDARVAVINTSTNTLSTTITLNAPAGQPAVGCVSGPTFNPAGTLGYFSLLCSGNTFNGNTINVLSIPSNTLVAAITVGAGPFQSAISPDGSRLYSANAVANTVSVINTATNAVIATVPMPGHSQSIAVTPDGAHVYVANSNVGTVSVIQTSTNTVSTSIPTTVPFGIVIASPPAASAATTLTLTPPNLVFGAQVDGTQSATQTISVKNPGATAVTLTSIFLSGPNIGDFRLINGCPNPPTTLGAGASCNLQLSSFPTTNGPREALVTINSTNGVAASTQSAPLSGTGISLVSIAVTPVNPSVIATNTVQFTATGTFNDKSTQNLTNSVIWASSSIGVATINASGLATGVAAGGPITITATSGNIFGTTQLTVTPLVTFPLSVTLIGTGTGSVTDNVGSINCKNTAGVISGTCTANYPSGTVVSLTATPTPPSTFGGYLGACSGTGACSVTMNSAQSVTASFVPPPQALPLPFAPGTNVSGQVAYDCPSNPNPTPANPCLDPNAHAAAFTIGQVLTPFTLTVVSTEVPPTNGDGICENGRTPGQDLDCRFGTFFTFQTKANGDRIVPLCAPYANGNCVVYSVFFQNPGQEPDPSMYVGPVNWNITYNNGAFVPPAPWTGSTPRLYYDPSGFVVPNSPYGTDCTTPMLIGSPGVPTSPAIFCQFVFDITTIFDASKKVDPLIGGKTKVFSDAVVAFPPNFAPVVTVTTTPDAATVTAGSPIGFTITVSNSAAAVANNVSLNTPLPGGTNVSWTINPAYTGPGTCNITGAQGSQVLNCAFGTLAQSASASLHILSATSAAGTAISPSTVNVGPQQLLSIGSIVVQPIPVTFSGLTASQTIPVGTSSVTLAGVVGNGTQFAPSGETVSITINGSAQPATIGSNGAFSVQFPASGIPISATAYPITYSYAGDSLLSSASNNTTTLTVTPLVVTFPLNVSLIGTGTGSVTDNLGSINCVNTAGVISGTCSANYPSGIVVVLTASATQPSTFGGWLQACSGTAGCSVTMNSAQAVTASFVPPPQAVPLPLTPGTNVTAQAPFDCPSNPNPTPTNPCLDPNAHAAAFTIGQVLTPFTLTVVSTEVPPTNGDGICENGRTPGQDLDCRFGTFFTFQTKANGDRIVPLCAPYANGNCVVYSVFFQNPGQEPDPSMYVGPVNWNITYNNGAFVPPAPWTGSTPRLYYDPSGFVVPNSPYGTDCTTPMLIGSPGVPTSPAIFCQFVFDITTIFDASKKVDPLIGGKTKVFSDAIVAFPPVFAPVVTVTTTPDAATVTAGSPIGFTITVSNSALAVANNVSLNTPLPGGTNVSWTISPAYAGPGTCGITGAQGSQVLACAFGTLAQSASASLHILSASSAAGTAISPSTVNVGVQQLLSIGSIVVQPIPVTFSGLTASQTIPVGTSSVTLGGVIGNGTQFAPNGETVSITINGNKQTATIGSNGAFSMLFPTAVIPGATTPYPITYSYAGDSLLSSATNSSTTLTVVSPPAGVNLSATLQSATIDGSGNYVFTIRVTNSGGTVATAAAIKTAVLTTVVGATRVTTASTTLLPVSLGNIASLSSVTTTLTFPASAGPPNTAGAISLGLGFTGGSASSALRATLP